MGKKLELLKESFDLLVLSEQILKESFDYKTNIKNYSMNEEEEIIIEEDFIGNQIQYDICDGYTALIKKVKIYDCEEIQKNFKKLKQISLKAESLY